MDDRQLTQLAERLLRAGVAPRYVRRSVQELHDHRQDLERQLLADGLDSAAAAREADARLGTVEMFYAATVARPELRSWSHRRPGLLFGLLPGLLYILLTAGCIALLVGLVGLVHPEAKNGVPVPARFRQFVDVWRVFILWGVPLLAAVLAATLAIRGRLRSWWPLLGIVVVAVISTAVNLDVTWAAPGTKGQMSAGVGYPFPAPERALTVMLLALLPYLVWRIRDARKWTVNGTS